MQQGSFTLLIDISDYLNCEDIGIDPHTESFNVPFNSYSSGAYFGDDDSIGTYTSPIAEDDEFFMDNPNTVRSSGNHGGKNYRSCTANAIKDTDIMKIKKSQLFNILVTYPTLKHLLERIAN